MFSANSRASLEPMRRACLLLSLVFGIACLVARAQPGRATQNPIPPTAQSSAPIEVRLGNSSIALAGPWKFSPGDSPRLANGTFLWASPAFDDAAWTNMDLHSTGGFDPVSGNSGYVTGWAARGFPHLSGFAWYRLRIHVDNASGPLWLKMPDHVDDIYQVFANGRFVGRFGGFTPNGAVVYFSRPRIFPLPAPDEHGDVLLAIRFYMNPNVLAQGNTGASGGMHQAPAVGLRAAIESMLAQAITGRILAFIVPVFIAFLTFLAALGAFWIWLIDRPHSTYLWLTLAFVLTAAPAVLLAVGLFSFVLTQNTAIFLTEILPILGLACWIFFWRRWFDLARNRPVELLIVVFAIAATVLELFFCFSTHASVRALQTAMEIRAALAVLLGVMLLVGLFQGVRKDRTGAFVALPAIVLLVISQFSQELLVWFGVRTAFFPFGVQISIEEISLFLLVLVVGVLVARRFLRSQVNQRLERQAVEQELEQARELQQHVLTPEPVNSSVFTVETAYHPARTVGGDFFQVIPHFDRSLLIVVGDVSGKGIAAAMLVAVLVGAIRTRADETFGPAAILRSLNDRLLGRAGGHFATCIVAHLRPGGVMTIANAGHLPPYRNGIALDLPGSLPLGIVADAEYDVHTIQLDAADHLTFVTDGVLEARNPAGQLLGFDHLAKISSQPPESIAQAAIAHGQEDDITVVSVRLCAAARELESSPILQTSPI